MRRRAAKPGVLIMNEVFDLWSLPWHALQRSLAETFRTEAASKAPAKPKLLISQIAQTTGSNWLARARGAEAPLMRASS
jgi:hypothetical protein